jgi:exonuclease SbcC
VSIKVRVRNFQSVEDGEILIDGLTVLTGTNNTGKSAFFRALRGAFTNTRGHAFVRHGKGHCTVDVAFDDAKTLTWKKGKGVNTYIVNGDELAKVGHGVPPEARVFGIDSVVAGKTELWPQIAPQITGVSFLLHETGSVIAEAVADVKRVNQLSRALAACDKDKRAARSQLKIRKADAKTLAEKAEGFAGLDAVTDDIFALDGQRNKAEKVTKALTNVGKLQQRHKSAREAVEALEGLEQAEQALPAQETIKTSQTYSRSLEVAAKLQARHRDAQAEVSALDGLEEAEQKIPDPKRTKKAQSVGSGLRGARKLQGRYQSAVAEVTALEGLEGAHEALPSDARVRYAQQFRKGVQVTVELAMKYERARDELTSADTAQEALTGIDLDENLIVRAGKFKKARSNAVNLKERYVKNRDAVSDLDRQIRDQQAELDALNESLVSVLGDVDECPTCGGGLDHVH